MSKSNRRRTRERRVSSPPPRSTVDAAVRDALTETVNEARKASRRMAPAHAFSQTAQRRKLVERATGLLQQLDPTNVPEHVPIRDRLEAIVRDRDVILATQEGEDTSAIMTFGMHLIGYPELVLRWPKVHAEAAREIVHDLVAAALNGARAKLQDQRRVFAMRLELSYSMEGRGLPDLSTGELRVMHNLTSTFLDSTVPPTLALRLLVDSREGVVLKGVPEPEPFAIWCKKDGRDVFTGLVRLPFPSKSFSALDMQFSVARLVDPAGALDGDRVILSPGEFMAELAQYD